MNNYIVKNTMEFSFFMQIIILLIGISAQFITVSKNKSILKNALFLENIVQFIEAGFYLWFIYFYKKNIDKIDIAKYRYYDWFITTPTMIVSVITYFYYNNNINNESKKIMHNIIDFFKHDFRKIMELLFYNLNMLIVGYLQEINIIGIISSTLIGFTFFGLLFYKMFIYYVANNKENYMIFFLMLLLWSLYGVAAIFNYKFKNAAYNILDIFSKNFFGLFLAYLIYNN